MKGMMLAPAASETHGHDLAGCGEGSRAQVEASKLGAIDRSPTEVAMLESPSGLSAFRERL